MKTLHSNSFRPSLETLEDRRLLAARVTAGLSFGILPPFAFDSTLTTSFRQLGSHVQIVVDGSDYDDVVDIVSFDPNRGDVEIQLQQWSGGIQIGSTRTERLHASNLKPLYTIFVDGKAGNDQIFNNTFASLAIFGGGENDVFVNRVGGSGQNYFSGGQGNDYFQGGDQADVAQGGEGDDTLYGYGGDDELYGDAGNDLLRGGEGNDFILGGLNNDTIEGGAGNDWLYGEAGKDRLFGNEGQDRLYGGADNDYLDGGYKAYAYRGDNVVVGDYLEGGLGADTFVRHKSFFGFNDPDFFAGYNTATGDRVEGVWHW